MMKKLLTILAIVALFATTLNAQWTNTGAWPDTNWTGSTHGIAVDPDGKVWTSPYYAEVPWIVGEDTLMTAGIRVFNADGTEAAFSPVVTVATGGGFIVDTLTGACRGMGTDENGNILYVQSGSAKMFKINYLTGEGMARADIDEPGSSPTAPSCSDAGVIYVGPVVGGDGKAIAMYDTDLNYLGNAVDGPPDISRTMEVSPDGNSIYWMTFTGAVEITIYQRADEFSPYDSVGAILKGMSVESSAWDPATGNLWVSSDKRGSGPYSSLTWYGYDVVAGELVDGFQYDWKDPTTGDPYGRGLDFSPDGSIAYAGTFSSTNYLFEKFTTTDNSVILFECDMTVQIARDSFDVSTGTITISGSMNGWDTEATPLKDPDGDGIYGVYLPLGVGNAEEYKFVMDGEYEVVPNRALTVAGNETVTAFFNDDEGGELTEIALTFTCDMEFEVVAERFVPGVDTISSAGSHNGWTVGATELFPTVANPNTYEGVHMYEAALGETIYYKYVYTSVNGTAWENSPETGSGNYEYIVTADDIAAGVAVLPGRRYNNSTLETVLNQEGTIRFIVDMNNAVDMNGLAFPSIDDVFIAGANTPLAWPQGGWPDEDVDLVHFLVDDGTGGDETSGDNFWTVELAFSIYSPLSIEYKYGANWGLASNNGANDNESGVGTNHFAELFPSFWEGDAVDVFGAMERKDVVNSIREIGSEIPNKYDLGQNYPNPFNPTTIINFSIPESGLVTLKVFNVLGQEVVTLVNEVKSAGTYEVDFDASQLTTGMYVYTISSGNYSATKKMMLVK